MAIQSSGLLRCLSVVLIFCSRIGHASREPRVLALDYNKVDVASSAFATNGALQRATTINTVIDNAQGSLLYLVNVTVGTPGQPLGLQLDTGSSDIWLPYSQSSVCKGRHSRCADGSYDPAGSSTYSIISSGTFEISYVDKTKIRGDYISDVFGLSGSQVSNMTMGLARSSTTPDSTSNFDGIIGVGFASGEALAAQTGKTYPNFLQVLVDQGVIATQAYSLWLNSYRASSGTILFGGVDEAKYHGDLAILPIQPDADSGTVSSFTITMDSFSVLGELNSVQYSQTNLRLPVVLDSGTTLTYLPDNIANAVSDGVGAVNSYAYGPVIPCSVGTTPASLVFGFGSQSGAKIVAPISEFVLPFPSDVRSPKFRDSNEVACRWGLMGAGNSPLLLGDTFLRSAYVVYNLAGKQIGLAQTNFNATDSNIKEITQASSIPKAATTANGLGVTQTATGLTQLQTNSLPTPTATDGAAASITGSSGPTFNLGKPTAIITSSTSPTPSKGAAAHVDYIANTGSLAAAVLGLLAVFV